jgi:hypothetical protein
MTAQQKAYLLRLLHTLPFIDRPSRLLTEISHFGISQNEMQSSVLEVENLFEKGIGNLNSNQLNNLLTFTQGNEVSHENIKRKLDFYEVDKKYQSHILEFLRDFTEANVSVDSGDLDKQFRGVQVASRDNFNTIINQGWTGDWDLNPNNIDPRRVQIASMNEDGLFPRGYYLNADIIDIQPIQHFDSIRYRLFIANPEIINSGNRNVKFIAQPVRYMR